MTNFEERLAAAKTARRSTQDVQVLLDQEIAERREKLEAQLADGPDDQRLTSISPKDHIREQLKTLLAEAIDALVTFRFTRLPGDQWAELTARCPARLSAPIDLQYGYNMHAVCRLAAPLSGFRVDGDQLIPLRVSKATEDGPAMNEWDDLFSTISGHEFNLIASTIYELNEYGPAKRVADLKKASATRTA